jgi:hypothetical protein
LTADAGTLGDGGAAARTEIGTMPRKKTEPVQMTRGETLAVCHATATMLAIDAIVRNLILNGALRPGQVETTLRGALAQCPEAPAERADIGWLKMMIEVLESQPWTAPTLN